MDTTEREAAAALAEDVGQALLRYAERLRAAPTDETFTGSPAKTPRAGRQRTGQPRGKQQQAVLAMRGLARGVTAAQVAAAVGLKLPNAYKTLGTLVDGGWLEVIPGEEPTRWCRTRD